MPRSSLPGLYNQIPMAAWHSTQMVAQEYQAAGQLDCPDRLINLTNTCVSSGSNAASANGKFLTKRHANCRHMCHLDPWIINKKLSCEEYEEYLWQPDRSQRYGRTAHGRAACSAPRCSAAPLPWSFHRQSTGCPSGQGSHWTRPRPRPSLDLSALSHLVSTSHTPAHLPLSVSEYITCWGHVRADNNALGAQAAQKIVIMLKHASSLDLC